MGCLKGTFAPEENVAKSTNVILRQRTLPPPHSGASFQDEATKPASSGTPIAKTKLVRRDPSFTYVREAKKIDIIKELDDGELEDVLAASSRGCPVVKPLDEVQARGKAAVDEPKLPVLKDYDRQAVSDPKAKEKCRKSFDELVQDLQQRDCGGDFKLANILEEPNTEGSC